MEWPVFVFLVPIVGLQTRNYPEMEDIGKNVLLRPTRNVFLGSRNKTEHDWLSIFSDRPQVFKFGRCAFCPGQSQEINKLSPINES